MFVQKVHKSPSPVLLDESGNLIFRTATSVAGTVHASHAETKASGKDPLAVDEPEDFQHVESSGRNHYLDYKDYASRFAGFTHGRQDLRGMVMDGLRSLEQRVATARKNPTLKVPIGSMASSNAPLNSRKRVRRGGYNHLK